MPYLFWMVAGAVVVATVPQQQSFEAINNCGSLFLDHLLYWGTWMGEAVVIIPGLLLLFAIKTYRSWRYFVLALCCNIIPFLLEQALKSWFDRPRPMYFFQTPGWNIRYLAEWPQLMHRSFPSGHSTGAMSFFCFLSLLLPPQSKRWGLLFWLLAMTVCYSRIYLAAHFFEDVYFGSMLGGISTLVIYTVLYRCNIRIEPSKKQN